MPQILNLLPFNAPLSVRQIAELILIVLLLLLYSKLKKAKVRYLLVVAILISLLDGRSYFIPYMTYLYPYMQIAMWSCLIAGLAIWRRLQRTGYLVLLTIVSFSVIIDYTILTLSIRGIYSVFLYNFHLLTVPILYYYLFYRHAISSFVVKYRRAYVLLVALSYIVFWSEYYLPDSEIHYNNLSVVVFYTEMVIISFVSVARLVMDEMNATRLTIQPLFWIATGTLFNAIVTIPIDGLQPFLLDNYLEIYFETRILPIFTISGMTFQYLCYFIAMYLIARNPVPQKPATIDPLKLIFNTVPEIKEPVLSPEGKRDNIFLKKK
ncbi:MAG TPA: hypothetical protein VF145_11445 [Chitinophagaceae bacterium]